MNYVGPNLVWISRKVPFSPSDKDLGLLKTMTKNREKDVVDKFMDDLKSRLDKKKNVMICGLTAKTLPKASKDEILISYCLKKITEVI